MENSISDRVLHLDKSYDLVLTYSWGNVKAGICGHLYECIEYYYILKQHFKVAILIGEILDKEILSEHIKEKYTFTDKEVNELLDNLLLANNPSIVTGTNLLVTDGGKFQNKILKFNKIFMFACSNFELKDNINKNIYVLQDNRVYEKAKVNNVHYIKKILLDKLRLPETSTNKNLLYLTKNCRSIERETFEELLQMYENDFLCITNSEEKYIHHRIQYFNPPVKNLFNIFSKYIYTPLSRKWDCSSRFIVECKHFGKEVIYHNINYLDEDRGLYWRKLDVLNNFESLFLKEDDEIILLIKEVLSEPKNN